MMAAVGDMLLGFRGQLRRSFGGVILLWFGMSVATVALLNGFSVAEDTLTAMNRRLSGDLDRICFFNVSQIITPADSLQPEFRHWNGFSHEVLQTAVGERMARGYFFEIHGRPIRVAGRAFEVTMVVYVSSVL